MAETAASTSSTPSIAYEYVWFNGKPVAQVDVATSTIHSVFTDHLGTPIAETDATGAIDWRAEYEPFGTVTTYRTGATRHQPLRFPGQEYDAADGSGEREYNIFRWYRQGWGRYTQADPMGLKADRDVYRYTFDSPIVYFDSLALQSLYQPGQPAVDDPLFPLPRNCSAKSWEFVGHRDIDDGLKSIWALIESIPIATGLTAPRGVGLMADGGVQQPAAGIPSSKMLNTGWCMCKYAMAGSMHYYRRLENWQRQVTCCPGGTATEHRNTSSSYQTLEPSIFDPRSIKVTGPVPQIDGSCACAGRLYQ